MISPKDVVKRRRGKFTIGVDGLRLWVASADYTTDVGVGEVALQNVAVIIQKLRATIRYILGNLDGVEKLDVEYKNLSTVFIFVSRS